MEIKVRMIPHRSMCSVSVVHDSATLDIGIFDQTERKALAQTFIAAAEELLSGLKDEAKP